MPVWVREGCTNTKKFSSSGYPTQHDNIKMMWKSFFRVQNFFSAFLNVPIVFDKESETFLVTPCNTLWRKIKRFLLTNLCLFVIWGISIYRLLHQLLTSSRDENFTVLDVVIISIALAFCTEGLAHIWTFHFSAGDICYILTQSLRLTKLHCYIPQQMRAWQRKLSSVSTTGSIVNGKWIIAKVAYCHQNVYGWKDREGILPLLCFPQDRKLFSTSVRKKFKSVRFLYKKEHLVFPVGTGTYPIRQYGIL